MMAARDTIQGKVNGERISIGFLINLNVLAVVGN